MKTLLIALSLCALVHSAGVAGGAAIPEENLSPSERLEALVEQIRQAHEELETLEAEFSQTKESALLVESERAHGVFSFAAPDKVRWEYLTPDPISLVIADRMMTTWYRDLRQVERAEVGAHSDRVLRYLGAGTSLDSLLEYFSVSLAVPTPDSESLHLSLEPRFKRVAKRLRGLDLWLDPDTYMPMRLRYVEGDGDVTEYSFTSVKLNEALPAERFELELPLDVDVRSVEIGGRSGAR